MPKALASMGHHKVNGKELATVSTASTRESHPKVSEPPDQDHTLIIGGP